MYLLQIKLFVFLLILSTSTAPGIVKKFFGKGSSSKHAAKQDVNEGSNGSARETGGSSSQQAANNEDDGEIDDGSMHITPVYADNSAEVATCKSQLSSEGYYDNVKDNWVKARKNSLNTRDQSHYENEQYNHYFGNSTTCGRIYSEMLVVVEDSKSDAFKELKGASGFCATFSGCVTQIAGENNYYADDDDQYSYY